MNKSSLLTLVFCLFGFSEAQALFEVRLTYGLLSSKPDLASVYTGTSTDVPSVNPNYGLGADAIFVFPVLKIGGGLRYENLGFKVDSNGLEFKSSSTRTALIVNYRIIDTLVFLGPIFTYGISHSNNLKWSNATSSADLSSESSSSYTLGLEGGVSLGGFMVGAEAGTETFKWNKMKDANGVLTATPDLDYTGTYFKVLFGFGI